MLSVCVSFGGERERERERERDRCCRSPQVTGGKKEKKGNPFPPFLFHTGTNLQFLSPPSPSPPLLIPFVGIMGCIDAHGFPPQWEAQIVCKSCLNSNSRTSTPTFLVGFRMPNLCRQSSIKSNKRREREREREEEGGGG